MKRCFDFLNFRSFSKKKTRCFMPTSLGGSPTKRSGLGVSAEKAGRSLLPRRVLSAGFGSRALFPESTLGVSTFTVSGLVSGRLPNFDRIANTAL